MLTESHIIEEERQKDKNLSFTDLFPKWLQWPKPGQHTVKGFPCISPMSSRAQKLAQYSTDFPGHQEGAGLQVEHLGHKRTLICNAGNAISSINHSATMPGPGISTSDNLSENACTIYPQTTRRKTLNLDKYA